MNFPEELFRVLAWIAVPVIVFLWLGRLYTRRRREEFLKFARKRGLSLSRGDECNSAKDFGDFDFFQRGGSFSVMNCLQGLSGSARVKMFDCRYRTGTGSSAAVHKQTVFALQSDRLILPVFSMEPENIFHKIVPFTAKKDIDFSQRRGFSENYVLRGQDETAIRGLFRDEILSFFENHKGLFVEGQGDRFLLYRSGRMIRTEDMTDFFNEGMGLFRLLEASRS